MLLRSLDKKRINLFENHLLEYSSDLWRDLWQLLGGNLEEITHKDDWQCKWLETGNLSYAQLN